MEEGSLLATDYWLLCDPLFVRIFSRETHPRDEVKAWRKRSGCSYDHSGRSRGAESWGSGSPSAPSNLYFTFWNKQTHLTCNFWIRHWSTLASQIRLILAPSKTSAVKIFLLHETTLMPPPYHGSVRSYYLLDDGFMTSFAWLISFKGRDALKIQTCAIRPLKR